MKRDPRHFVIDDIAAALLRKPTAGPLLKPNEIISCGLNYAMQFEFWKFEINEESTVVRAVEQALRLGGYEIKPIEAKRSDDE